MKYKLLPFIITTPLVSLSLSSCIFHTKFKILANYNGQADLLLSLQIPPDYYPLQFKEKRLRDYLVNPQDYLITNHLTSDDKKVIKQQIKNRFTNLLKQVTTFGPSLWNNAIYNSGDVSRNVEFWTTKKVDLMFMERFVLDDFKSILSSALVLPEYKNLIETNFRASRDQFTTFSKNVFAKIENNNHSDDQDSKLALMLSKWLQDAPDEDPDALYRYASYMRFWQRQIESNKAELKKAGMFDWVANYNENSNSFKITNYKPIFFPESQKMAKEHQYDQKLAALYQKVIFDSDSEKKIQQQKPGWQLNYLTNFPPKIVNQRYHHPAFEQQADPGSSPAAEGSQRDAMIYLYQLANGINGYVKKFSTDFQASFQGDPRQQFLQHALHNVSWISHDLKNRLKAIRTYFQKIQVVDENYNPENNNYDTTNSKIVSIVTYPPTTGGAGNATIQTISKFAFIYHDLGLKQVLPLEEKTNNSSSDPKVMELDYTKDNSVKYAGYNPDGDREKGYELFNIDDNGWWWNLGDAHKDTSNLKHFVNSSDTVIITATTQDWNRITGADDSITSGARVLSSIAKNSHITTFKNSDINNYDHHLPNAKKDNNYPVNHVEYGLWNEGLRSPFAVNMVLDQLVSIIQNQYDHNLLNQYQDSSINNQQDNNQSLYQKAMDWGCYWKDYFINASSSQDYYSDKTTMDKN